MKQITDKISLRRDRTIQKFISKRKIFPIRREATEKNSRERNFFFEVQKKKKKFLSPIPSNRYDIGSRNIQRTKAAE